MAKIRKAWGGGGPPNVGRKKKRVLVMFG